MQGGHAADPVVAWGNIEDEGEAGGEKTPVKDPMRGLLPSGDAGMGGVGDVAVWTGSNDGRRE